MAITNFATASGHIVDVAVKDAVMGGQFNSAFELTSVWLGQTVLTLAQVLTLSRDGDRFEDDLYWYVFGANRSGVFGWTRNYKGNSPSPGTEFDPSDYATKQELSVQAGRLDKILNGSDTLYDEFKEVSDAIKKIFGELDIDDNQFAQLVALINQKAPSILFGAVAVLFVSGVEVKGFDSVQAAINAIPNGKTGTIIMTQDTINVEVTRSCTIYGGGNSIGRLQASGAGVMCHYIGQVNSTYLSALYAYLGGSIKMTGNINHTCSDESDQLVTIVANGDGSFISVQGNIDLISTNPNARMFGSNKGVTWDLNGIFTIRNKGTFGGVQGKSTLRGAFKSFDGGLGTGNGDIDIYASIDTSASTSTDPLRSACLIQTQSPGTGSLNTRLHSGSELLAPAGRPTTVNNNAATGQAQLLVSSSVTFSVPPNPATTTVTFVDQAASAVTYMPYVADPARPVGGSVMWTRANGQVVIMGPTGAQVVLTTVGL